MEGLLLPRGAGRVARGLVWCFRSGRAIEETGEWLVSGMWRRLTLSAAWGKHETERQAQIVELQERHRVLRVDLGGIQGRISS